MKRIMILLLLLCSSLTSFCQSSSDSVMVAFTVNSGKYLMKIDGKQTSQKQLHKLTPGNHQVVIWSFGSNFLDTVITVQNVPSQMLRITLSKNMTLRAEKRKANIYLAKRWIPGVSLAIATAVFTKRSIDSFKLRNEYYDEALKQKPLYDQADHHEDIAFFETNYTYFKEKMYEQQRKMTTNVALSSASALATYFCFHKYRSKRPTYTDPGKLQFETAWIDMSPRTGSIGLSIKLSLR